MLIIVQFPITDLRPFLDSETGRLTRPYWNVSTPDEDFVRSFGHIRVRRLGGLTGWVGEGTICEANRAIRFDNLNPFLQKETNKNYQSKIVFKRFYADGMSLGKFEIGIRIKFPKKVIVSESLIKDLLLYVLQISVVVPYGAEQTKCHFIDAGKPLSKLYLLSTTEVSFINQVKNSWVKFGKPMLMVLRGGDETRKEVPFLGKEINTKSQEKTDLYYYLLSYSGKNYPVYFFGEKRLELMSRPFRIYIARLYAEKECLKKVLESVRAKEINIDTQSRDASDNLQQYLNLATRIISDLESKTDSLSSKIDDYARNAMELISPGEKDEILKALKRIRPNVLHKVEKFVNQIVFQENIMGDKYTVGQAGAVGPNAHAHDMDFHQLTWNSEGKIDLSKLADELSRLREKMKEESTKPEHDTSVVAVASAEVAAKEGNSAKVFENLAKAGQWALDVATKIGVAIAVEALKTVLKA